MNVVVCQRVMRLVVFFFFKEEDGIRDKLVTGVQTCALPISLALQVSTSRLRGLTPKHFVGPYTLPAGFGSPTSVESTQTQRSRTRATRSHTVRRSASACGARREPATRRTALSFPVRVCRVRSLHCGAVLQRRVFLHARYGSVRDMSSPFGTRDDNVHPRPHSDTTCRASRVRMRARDPA